MQNATMPMMTELELKGEISYTLSDSEKHAATTSPTAVELSPGNASLYGRKSRNLYRRGS
jgi:hypothetical protein